jgi:Flp pilus assembly pilin Flp
MGAAGGTADDSDVGKRDVEESNVDFRREDGQTLAEYGVTLAVITIALLAIFTGFGAAVAGSIQRVVSLIPA